MKTTLIDYFRTTLVTISTIALIVFAVPAARSADSEASAEREANPAASSGQQAGGQSASLDDQKTDDIIGMEVINAEDGSIVGRVDKLVTDKDQRQLCAVIAVDQVLDLVGGKEVAVSIDDLEWKNGKLQISATEQELKARPDYQREDYYNVSENSRPISDFTRMETTERKP